MIKPHVTVKGDAVVRAPKARRRRRIVADPLSCCHGLYDRSRAVPVPSFVFAFTLPYNRMSSKGLAPRSSWL